MTIDEVIKELQILKSKYNGKLVVKTYDSGLGYRTVDDIYFKKATYIYESNCIHIEHN